MKEWEQEYQRKERERRIKELQHKEELDSMEMASKILRGPPEDVSVFAKHNHSGAFPKGAHLLFFFQNTLSKTFHFSHSSWSIFQESKLAAHLLNLV